MGGSARASAVSGALLGETCLSIEMGFAPWVLNATEHYILVSLTVYRKEPWRSPERARALVPLVPSKQLPRVASRILPKTLAERGARQGENGALTWSAIWV